MEASLFDKVKKQFNFFRLHLLTFTLVPLVFSCFFYAANGSAGGNANGTETGIHRVTYVDSLFLCFSAMTVTGMVPVNLSAIHPFQQFLLFFLFIIGDYSFVSLVMVLVRKRFFRQHCAQLLQNYQIKRTNTLGPSYTTNNVNGLFNKAFTFHPPSHHAQKVRNAFKKGNISTPIDARPVDDYIEEPREIVSPLSPKTQFSDRTAPTQFGIPSDPASPPMDSLTSSPRNGFTDPPADNAITPSPTVQGLQRAQPRDLPRIRTIQIAELSPQSPYAARQRLRAQSRGMSISLPPPALRPTTPTPSITVPNHVPTPTEPRYTGMGGFQNPLSAVISPLVLPSIHRRLSRPERRLTIVASRDAKNEEGWPDHLKAEAARWLPQGINGLVIGRNSQFFTSELEDEELEEIGGVEYRALKLLSYFIGSYIFLCQAIPFAIMAIYFACVNSFDSAFQASPGVQAGNVNKTWFSLFVSSSAYTGTGMTLVDQSMVPLANCYLVIWLLSVILLIGNNALPMMLRFLLWLGTKIWRRGERHETLHFLLDHPRRCFLYLFPSHQTWFLFAVLIAFSAVELVGFYLLNIGLPILQAHNPWELFSDGVLQSLAVRASGFGILPIATFSPALLFLYVILMYVAIYPIAMSVRSTNVYEERALGVYEDHTAEDENEPNFQGKDKREIFSKYLFWHMRRQLAFDIWPLGLAIMLICICERGKILDPSKSAWFSIFRIIFECTSAYSTIGLTLGTPNNNYSFCAEWGTVSKLVMILVMLRGRHRGLPVAIDRAILLPKEMARIDRRGAESKAE